MKLAAVVFWTVAWLSCAVWALMTSEPLSRWLFAMICTLVALGEARSYLGERITSETARTKAITEAMRVLGDRAVTCNAAGDPASAIVLLDAAEAVGKLTDKASQP